jgi:riboflavin kinase/FMN adenylyltransferase
MSIKEKVIALGFFDGVHLGHGALLRRTVEEAARRGCTPALFTYDRPPKEVVTGIPCPLINSPEDRRELAKRLYGIRDVLMVPFDREMMTTSWEDFITEILVGRYHAVHLVAGHDHHFGHKNQGSPELLAEKCRELGLGCDIIPKVEIGGIEVSSTYIRRLVELGQIDRANRYLGHPHTLTGTVRHGRGLGSARLFPTANLTAPAPGMVRDFFLFEASWFKDETGNWGFGFGFTVDPLPFSNMTGFPYPADESYPNDTAHQNYLRDWNTRIIAAPDDSASQNSLANVAFPFVLMLPVMAYVMFKSPRLALGMAKKRRSYVTCRCCLM